MASFQDLSALLAGRSSTGGYDAVLALSVPQLNAFLFHQYASSNPGTPVRALSAMASVDGTNFWLLGGSLGAPGLAFASDDSASLTMDVVSGVAMSADLSAVTPHYAVLMEGGSSSITGNFPLSSAQGSESVLGTVQIDFGAGSSWSAAIEGVSGGSTAAAAVGEALSAVYHDVHYLYQLGSISNAGALACLVPTRFTFAVQNLGGVTNLLLLIETTNQGGTTAPTVNLIPDGAGAALLVSNEIVFKELLAKQGIGNFGQQLTVQATTSAGAYAVQATGGSLNLGPIQSQDGSYWSGDGIDPAPVIVPLTGMTLGPSASGIGLSLSSNWSQTWGKSTIYIQDPWTWNTLGMLATLSGSLDVSVQGGNSIVSSLGKALQIAATVPDPPGWFAQFFGFFNVPSTVTTVLASAVQTQVENLQVPAINTFSLQNLLFPQGSSLNLSQAAFPCDLYATGSVMPVLSLTPATVTMAPGQSQTFSATENGAAVASVLWGNTPFLGSWSGNTFTAPSNLRRPLTIVITATDESDANKTGYALVTVVPGATTGLAITPGAVAVASGAHVPVNVIDGNGDQVANAVVTASVGTVQSGIGGLMYAAPTVTTATDLTLSASYAGQTATASWRVLPIDATLSIQASATTVAAGGTVNLTASGQQTSAISWACWCNGQAAGNVVGTGAGATYIAPTSPSGTLQVYVAAFYAGSRIGVALTQLTVG